MVSVAEMSGSDEMGRSALHLCCFNGHFAVAEVLIQHGAPVNAKDRMGATALHMAAISGHAKIVELLIANGAQIGAKTVSGDNAFELAYDKEHYDVVSCILDCYKSVSQVGYWSASNILLDAVRACHIPLAISALSKGADVNIGDEANATPLHIACELNNVNMATLLLDNGARVDVINSNFQSPLHSACMNGGLELVKMLVKGGAKVNALDREKSSALHTACYFQQSSVINVLHDYGADIFCKDEKGVTPLFSLIRSPINSPQGFLNGFLVLRYDVESVLKLLSDMTPIGVVYKLEKRVLLIAMMTACGHISDIPPALLTMLTYYKELDSLFAINQYGFLLKKYTVDLALKQFHLTKLEEFKQQPPSLLAACRMRVRACVCKRGLPIEPRIQLLPVPESVKKYLRFESEIEQLTQSGTE
ncbi:ankyrin repeat and SOCS box protein 8-like [Lineus longissimus]|uniref:ankyrin repeat and SOCS box protein 8-like n=1 Tax=Lineus longissimus TaxID=88925 RepID=UPI002B4F34B7